MLNYYNKSTQLINLHRINKVIDHIEQNLDDDLSLHTLANIACYSPFHFHRIFATICGETVHEFVLRKRIEKVAIALLKQKRIPIKELILQYGFDNATSFSRSFKKVYGMSGTAFRAAAKSSFNRIVKQNSKIGKETISMDEYIHNVENITVWMEENAKMEVKKIKAFNLAYVRNQGSFELALPSFKKLRTWAQTNGFHHHKDRKWLMVIHDNPAITEELKLRYSAGIMLPDDFVPGDEIGTMTITPGRFLIGSFKLFDSEFKRAWDGMSIWMMDKGFESRDGYYFELFHDESLFQDAEKHTVDICIPVK